MWLPSLKINLNIKKSEMANIPEIMQEYFVTKKLNLKLLENYISIIVNIHRKEGPKESYHKYKMEYCTK